jgi:Fe-S cluster assembly iron-binding protein IscA
MAITLTDTAAERVVGFLANRGSGLGIRLLHHSIWKN